MDNSEADLQRELSGLDPDTRQTLSKRSTAYLGPFLNRRRFRRLRRDVTLELGGSGGYRCNPLALTTLALKRSSVKVHGRENRWSGMTVKYNA
jgi:hypothetical protein